MKKVFSLLLAVLMLVSALPVAYAADTQDYSLGTAVKYTAENKEEYTITVPAKLAPGAEGTVTLDGYWASNTVVSVTAEENVVLTNSINANDKKTLDVYFDGISEAGDNNGKQTFTAPVSVAGISNALFGTWSGEFNYNVEVVDIVAPGATFSDGVTLSWDELKLEENGTKYGYIATAISDTEIGEAAFMQCETLISISIPDSITRISGSAFHQCTNLTNVTFGANSQFTIIDEFTFAKCKNLTSISVPDSVTTIGEYAFCQCTNLASVTLGNSVATIGADAFGECTNLTNINIPNSVTNIGDMAFKECPGLADDNGFVIIRNALFDYCGDATNVDIPDGITSIEMAAFGRQGLQRINIPDSVTSIGSGAFGYCTELATINYEGTATQWNAIEFGEDWNYDVPATEVICSDGTVSLS